MSDTNKDIAEPVADGAWLTPTARANRAKAILSGGQLPPEIQTGRSQADVEIQLDEYEVRGDGPV